VIAAILTITGFSTNDTIVIFDRVRENLRSMRRDALGHVINVSSFLSRVPLATYRSAYNAAKAALNALTANLRVDLAAAHPDVHVSLVIPGLVSTGFQRNALGGTPPMTGLMPAPQSADEVAAVIASVMDTPVAEIYTNPRQAAIAQKYLQDVEAFERQAAKGT